MRRKKRRNEWGKIQIKKAKLLITLKWIQICQNKAYYYYNFYIFKYTLRHQELWLLNISITFENFQRLFQHEYFSVYAANFLITWTKNFTLIVFVHLEDISLHMYGNSWFERYYSYLKYPWMSIECSRTFWLLSNYF